MPQPVSPPITSTPAAPYQNYDASDTGPCDRWDKLEDNAGPLDLHTGRPTGSFTSGDQWQQV